MPGLPGVSDNTVCAGGAMTKEEARQKAKQLKDAKAVLLAAQKLNFAAQAGRIHEINNAFKVLWDSGPAEEEFSYYTGGLIFTFVMLYHLGTHPYISEK